jgi:EPS-associated MarR family transcriptional regulator
VLTDEYRYRILKLLAVDPHASQRRIADELGISLGRVNFCLKALIEKGLVKARNFKSNKAKRAYMYYLTPQGFQEKAAVTVRFFRRKLAEYEALQAEIETLRREAAREQTRTAQVTDRAS